MSMQNVSDVLTCYNGARWISGAIESVLARARGSQSTYDQNSRLPAVNFPSLAPNLIFLAKRKKYCSQ